MADTGRQGPEDTPYCRALINIATGPAERLAFGTVTGRRYRVLDARLAGDDWRIRSARGIVLRAGDGVAALRIDPTSVAAAPAQTLSYCALPDCGPDAMAELAVERVHKPIDATPRLDEVRDPPRQGIRVWSTLGSRASIASWYDSGGEYGVVDLFTVDMSGPELVDIPFDNAAERLSKRLDERLDEPRMAEALELYSKSPLGLRIDQRDDGSMGWSVRALSNEGDHGELPVDLPVLDSELEDVAADQVRRDDRGYLQGPDGCPSIGWRHRSLVAAEPGAPTAVLLETKGRVHQLLGVYWLSKDESFELANLPKWTTRSSLPTGKQRAEEHLKQARKKARNGAEAQAVVDDLKRAIRWSLQGDSKFERSAKLTAIDILMDAGEFEQAARLAGFVLPLMDGAAKVKLLRTRAKAVGKAGDAEQAAELQRKANELDETSQ